MTPDNYVKVRIGGGSIDIAKRFCFVELKHGEPLSQQYRKSRYSLSSASEEFSGSTEHDTFSNRELLERAKQHRLETKLSENIGDVLAAPLRRKKKRLKSPVTDNTRDVFTWNRQERRKRGRLRKHPEPLSGGRHKDDGPFRGT